MVFGWIADKWGRRTAFFAILFLEVIFSIATSFSPNYVIYTALRTVNGLSFPAIYQIPFILGRREREREIKKRKFKLSNRSIESFFIFFFPSFFLLFSLLSALELMGPRYRTFAGMVICMFFASAMSLLAVLVTRHRSIVLSAFVRNV